LKKADRAIRSAFFYKIKIMSGYCQGSPLNITEASCKSNGGAWSPDPSTGNSGGGMSGSEIFSGIGNILGPLSNMAANMFAASKGQPQVPFNPVNMGTGSNVQNGQNGTQPSASPMSSSMIYWVLGIVLLLIVIAGVIIAMRKSKGNA